jgi:hypothetical protein
VIWLRTKVQGINRSDIEPFPYDKVVSRIPKITVELFGGLSF